MVLIDLYCERTGPGLLQEPINTVSNIAFLIAAIIAYYRLDKRGNSDVAEMVLIISAVLVGIGSILFHTFANPIAHKADIVPIWFFVGSYTLLAVYRLSGENKITTLALATLATGGLVLLNVLALDANVVLENTSAHGQSNVDLSGFEPASFSPGAFNGSIDYLPVVMTLLTCTIAAAILKHPIKGYLALASFLFIVALFFRTIDLSVCHSTIGIGTHFLWHLLNGIVVFVLLDGMIYAMPRKPLTNL